MRVCVCWLSCLLVCRARTLLQLPPQMCLDKKFFFCSRGRAWEPKIGVSARARADPAGVRVCVVRACAGAGAGNQHVYSTSLAATAKTIALGVCVCSLPWMLSKKEEVSARAFVLPSPQAHA